MTQPPNRQRGATLLVAMIFLVLISLFAISAYKSSTSQLRVVGNMQARQEAIAAAQQAIEQTISSSQFITNPTAAVSLTTDIDANGVPDYTATLTPTPRCYRAQPVNSSQLDPTVPANLVCLTGLGGIPCVDTEWDVSAEVVDEKTGASVTVHQGVEVRLWDFEAESFCQP